MKTITTVIIVLILMWAFKIDAAITTNNTPYCLGWESGYKDGWCDQEYGCIEPIVPICPVPNAGFDSYQDGYSRGFKKGLRDAGKY